eukprot:m.444340 g.444340  ORF g.444340 m.444340 type:complete len:126 (+) comp19088_c0_seq1:2121-2498(+)
MQTECVVVGVLLLPPPFCLCITTRALQDESEMGDIHFRSSSQSLFFAVCATDPLWVERLVLDRLSQVSVHHMDCPVSILQDCGIAELISSPVTARRATQSVLNVSLLGPRQPTVGRQRYSQWVAT